MTTADRALDQEFFKRWGEAIASVLSQIAGATWTTAPDITDAAPSNNVIAVDFTVAKSLEGRVRLRVAGADAAAMVAIFTGEAAQPEWNAEQQEALDELARQFAGQLATSLKPDVGEVEFRLEAATGFTAAGPASPLLLRGPGGKTIRFDFEIDQQLKAAFAPTPAPTVTTPHPTAADHVGNLDLLMDVELAVTLRFGQRQMMLQDILDLQSGSVIELDREIQEPVDLLLDGRVIARGSVVVVDGNYGLRVTEVGAQAVSGV